MFCHGNEPDKFCFYRNLGLFLPICILIVSLLTSVICWISIFSLYKVDGDVKDFVNRLVKYFKPQLEIKKIPPRSSFADAKRQCQDKFENIKIIILIRLERLNKINDGNVSKEKEFLERILTNFKDPEETLSSISENKWDRYLEANLEALLKAYDRLLNSIETQENTVANEQVVDSRLIHSVMQGIPNSPHPNNDDEFNAWYRRIQELAQRTFSLDETSFNKCLDKTEHLLKLDYLSLLKREKLIKILSKAFTAYSIAVFVGVFVTIGLVIFVSNLFLTETTGSCDSDMDCYANDLNRTIGPLDINSCYDYLRANFSIHCYSCSFNYVLSISKSGSMIAFGNAFLAFEVALLVGLIHIGNKTSKSLKMAAVLFFFANIGLCIFYFFSVLGIFIYELHYKSSSTKTIAYQLEIYLGYFVNLTCTLFIPLIFTSFIFVLFLYQNHVGYLNNVF